MSKLPCKECRGQCCTYPAFSNREFKTVRKKYKIPKNTNLVKFENIDGVFKGQGVMPILEDGTCVFLHAGACSIYDLRPRVCRVYGEIPQLPCQYLFPEKALEQQRILLERNSMKVSDLQFNSIG